MIGLLILVAGIGFFIKAAIIEIEEIRVGAELEYQEEHIRELQEKVDFYKGGMNKTLKQNIYLKKKLGRYES